PLRGAVVPDPWTVGMPPSPEELSAYYLFVQRNVQEYTNDPVPLSKGDYARFLKFMALHGLSLRTVKSIAAQLWSERRAGKGRWKRATILDKLQRDLFLHYFKKLRPSFSTFFLNSTAHFQHAHWRNMDPEPLVAFTGITGCQKVEPVMSEQFHLRFATDREAAAAAERLRALRIEGRQAMHVEHRGSDIFSGCKVFSPLGHEVLLEGGPKGTSISFFRLF